MRLGMCCVVDSALIFAHRLPSRLWGARVLLELLREDEPTDLQTVADHWGVREAEVENLLRRAGRDSVRWQ